MITQDLKDAYLTGPEVAAILKMTHAGVAQLIRKGKIPAQKIANRWLVPRPFIEEFAKTYVPKVGRPRTKRKYTRRQQE